MELSPSWKVDSSPVNQEVPAFLGTGGFIAAFTRALYRSLSWTRPIQFIPPHPISPRSILILSNHLRLGLPSGGLLLAFPSITYIHCSPHSCSMPWQTHSPRLDHCNYSWWWVQVLKLFIMLISPTSSHFISSWSKYSPQLIYLK
jgi:hypothetical protein